MYAELPAELRHQAGRDLLADRHLRAGAELAGRLNLEDVEADLALDRRQNRRRDEARGDGARAHEQLLLLLRRQLIGGRVDHDERENVG